MGSHVPDQCSSCGGFNGPGHIHTPYVDHKAEIVKAAIRFRDSRPRQDGHSFTGDLQEMDAAEEALLAVVEAYRPLSKGNNE